MATKSKVTQMVDDELDGEQSFGRVYATGTLLPRGGSYGSRLSEGQTADETGSGEEFVDEVLGTGDVEADESYGFGEETTEADEANNHTSMSNPPRAPQSTEGEAEETTDTESVFETVEGWDESQLTEATGEGEPLVEAFYADTEAGGGEEFFGAIASILLPVAKAVLPTLASAVVQQGASRLSPRLQQIMQRLGKLGISPATLLKRRETGDGYGEAVEMDEATLEALEQQIEALEVVIGRDDRVRVNNTKVVPWKRICHLKIQAGNGKSYLGTGFFIGPRTIITAGHCVYIHGQGGWVRQIVVTPGRNESQAPFGTYTATSFRSVRGWVIGKSRDYDYGAIILPRNAAIPSGIGAFGFGHYSDQFLRDKRLNTAGYPGDKPSGTMWFHGRKAKSFTPRTIVYDTDTAGGQSGSAVWFRGNDGKRIAVGIHTNGAPSGNSATRITKAVFENLKRWRTEGGLS